MLENIYIDLKHHLSRKLRGSKRDVTLGKGVYIAKGTRFGADVTIGNYTRINGPAIIRGTAPVSIGKYCAIGDGLRIISNNHDLSYANLQIRLQNQYGFSPLHQHKGPIIIGNNVWIGDNTIILPGAKIDDGVAIAAGSVVTKYIPPFSVVAGVPARIIRKRFDDDIIEKLMQIKWWDWPSDRIARNKEFFNTNLTNIQADELESLIK